MRAMSLGDSKPLKRVQQTFPLPNTRNEIVSKISNILESGGVQKVTVELGQPIKVEKLIPAATAGVDAPMELRDDDWMSAIRNGEMEDAPESADLGKYVFQSFFLLSQRGAKPRILMLHRKSELRTWFKLDPMLDIQTFFGVEVQESQHVPENTAVLVGVDPDDDLVPVAAVRLVFDARVK